MILPTASTYLNASMRSSVELVRNFVVQPEFVERETELALAFERVVNIDINSIGLYSAVYLVSTRAKGRLHRQSLNLGSTVLVQLLDMTIDSQ